MATAKMAQVDITPSSGPTGLNIHFHGPAGHSASEFNNVSDFPNVAPGASAPSGGKAVSTKIQGTQGQAVRFANPS
jgi:hypothetical protein